MNADLLILVRTLHWASLFSLAGGLAFAALVAEPAFRRHPAAAGAPEFRRRLSRLVWASLGLALISGPLWLILGVQSATSGTLAEVCSQEVLGTVLSRSHFGRAWALRGALAGPLILCLLIAWRRRSAIGTAALWMALALSAEELATVAGTGHAAAENGGSGFLSLFADASHLLAAGGWLGGLAPLALLLATARHDAGSSGAAAAREATQRFSELGMLAVGIIVATGAIKAVFLVGSIPALLGTGYGHLLMIKVALFLVLVTVAASHRRWPTRGDAAGAADAGPAALAEGQRGVLIEVGLGGAILLLMGALAATPPAPHEQPQWPLPFRLSLAAVEAVPRLRLESIAAGLLALGGLALLGYGLARPRQRTAALLGGLFLFLATAWWPLQFMVVTAYPTSFYQSPVPFTATSIMRGAQVYAANCAACHGAGGRGDGPRARSLPVAPADLTAEHVFGHSDGDLFWWISQGIPAAGMPGFASLVAERGRWDVINLIHARAAAAQPLALQPEVTAGPAPPAPDFAFERAGRQGTLRQAVAQRPVLLVLYRLPGSLPRLKQLAAAESRLGTAGLGLLATPVDAPEADGRASPDLPDFAAAADADTAGAYALFTGDDHPGHCEFLIDGAGFLRARWTSTPADTAGLLAELDRLKRLPLAARAVHTHAH